MIWQDMLFTAGSILFSLGLLPQLRDCLNGYSLNMWTTVMTTVVLALYCVAYASLGLWFAAIPFTATVWAAIAVVSYRNRKKVQGVT